MSQAQQSSEFIRNQPKYKKNRFSHTANTKYGMGDNYGTGVKNNMGKVRDIDPVKRATKKQIGKAPKSLA